MLGPYHFCPLLSPSLHECSLGISNFHEEISSVSHSIVFLYFFALITEEGFLISPCYFWNLHSDGYIFPFLLCLELLFFSQLFVRPLQTIIFPFCISFLGDGFDHHLLYNVMNLHLLFFRHSVFWI